MSLGDEAATGENDDAGDFRLGDASDLIGLSDPRLEKLSPLLSRFAGDILGLYMLSVVLSQLLRIPRTVGDYASQSRRRAVSM